MPFKLGLAQCKRPEDGDIPQLVGSWMKRAAEQDVDLLVFPEALMTPFDASPSDFAKQAQPLDGPLCTAINQLAAEYGLWAIYTANEKAGGEDGDMPRPPYNTAVIVDSEGNRRAFYRKVHLFDTDFIQESAKVSAGDSFLKPVSTPFGRIGVGICYDLRFPEQARAAALEGADLMVYPAGWVDGPDKVAQWKTLLAARAIENEFFVAGLSRCDRSFGKEKLSYAGSSCVFDPLGRPIAQAAGIEEELVTCLLDLDEIARARKAMPVLDHIR